MSGGIRHAGREACCEKRHRTVRRSRLPRGKAADVLKAGRCYPILCTDNDDLLPSPDAVQNEGRFRLVIERRGIERTADGIPGRNIERSATHSQIIFRSKRQNDRRTASRRTIGKGNRARFG
jgi:hypothetical protein